MFGWYRGQCKQHGIIDASRLFWRVGLSRVRFELANRLLAPKSICPCCGWRGRRFLDYIELKYRSNNTVCPSCDSHSRHRAFYLWLTKEYGIDTKAGLAVVFAPERALSGVWAQPSGLNVCRVDYEPGRGVDVLLDIQRLPFSKNSVDLIWCHHVLEHVQDDRRAMDELSRVLRPETGELIVSVPIVRGEKTLEYGFADPGESGHWRLYGEGFFEALKDAGLTEMRIINYRPPSADLGYGFESEEFYICRKKDAGASNLTPEY